MLLKAHPFCCLYPIWMPVVVGHRGDRGPPGEGLGASPGSLSSGWTYRPSTPTQQIQTHLPGRALDTGEVAATTTGCPCSYEVWGGGGR